ncbi:choline/carnitine O-acyltransferase [Candidatus Bathyarchaeota archaeon]|nr:choline/carnitine O-acyltransferase [Candidatus Bathyarchaeota archaeon]
MINLLLQDHPFELMSHDDYMTATSPKVQGTRNLDAAFGSSDSLDFFIMLSSITSILGKSGQSNYSVGNAYQDAFAEGKMATSSSRCMYVALNLGAVDGSLAITSLPAAQQEIMRQGSVLMSFDEVFTVMKYAMGPQADKDGLRQIILGFDRKSMEAVHDEFALANPLFSQVPHLGQKGGDTKKAAATDIGKMLQEATTPEDIHRIVVTGICQRFALFTACPPEDVSPDVSMESFGLDSLVAIELKNWLVRTFQTTLQTSEVLDAPDIASLARTIALRSKLVAKDKDAETTEKEEDAGGNAEKTDLVTIESAAPIAVNHDFDCCRASKDLRKMPLVDFETMFDDYLQNSQMFFTPEEFQTLERDVAEFRAPGSTGRKLYDRLHEQAHDPEIENWQDKYFLQSMYLQRRMPLAPFNNFMGFHPLGNMGHSQAERAALIASIAFRCKQDLEAGRWEAITYMGVANCSDLWRYIFNSARLPGVPLDSMAKFPGNDYLAVLHRGHIFKVMLKDGAGEGENVSVEALTDIFQSILDRQEGTGESWTSMLSADDRTSWAEVSLDRLWSTNLCDLLLTGCDTLEPRSSHGARREQQESHRHGGSRCFPRLPRRHGAHTRGGPDQGHDDAQGLQPVG